jgi:hypothetical protein
MTSNADLGARCPCCDETLPHWLVAWRWCESCCRAEGVMVDYDIPVLHADSDGCPVVVGMARTATQDVLVCNRPMPCVLHVSPNDGSQA